MVKRRRARGRRRRNSRTQRPVRILTKRTGVGRTTEVETSEWLRPPTSWDLAALAMRVQVHKSEAKRKRRARRRYINRVENQKEARAERWRARFRKSTDSPFSSLPGMSERTGATHRKPPAVPPEERQQSGMASRGSATTLGPELASTILELRAEGVSYRRIAAEVQHPESTIRHWIGSGRAEAVSTDRE